MNIKYDQVADLLSRAQRQGISVFEREQKLKIRANKNKKIDPTILSEIKKYKADILDFLKDGSNATDQLDQAEERIAPFDRDQHAHIPLSFSQEQLWLIDQMEGSVQYHVPNVLRLKGSVDKEVLELALAALVDRHEVFRTVFKTKEDQAYQEIISAAQWKMTYSEGAIFEEEAYLKTFVEAELKRPYDLSRDYMFRAHLIKCKAEEHVLILMVHHIASDGWSMSVIVKDLVGLYAAKAQGEKVGLPALPIQYADYAMWQRKRLAGTALEQKVKWWEEQLKGVEPLNLPTDFPRQAKQSGHAEVINFSISKEQTEQLKNISLQNGATLFMSLLTIFKILLYRYSGQEDLCVGTPIANRQRKELESIVGFFVNSLALRSDLSANPSFLKLLQQVKNTTLNVYLHQEIPFEQVVRQVAQNRDLGRNPLFQVVFILQNTPEIPALELGPIQISPVTSDRVGAKFELTVAVNEIAGMLDVWIDYNAELFTKATMERMGTHFQLLLNAILANPQQTIDQLPLLTTAERQQILQDFNTTSIPYPQDKTISALFEQQVKKTPDAIALTFEGANLSYQELNIRANQLAHYLIEEGVKEKSLVAFCLDRSLELIVSVLAILKAGAAYVPIDPAYPEERIKYMKEDSQCSFYIDHTILKERIQTIDNQLSTPPSIGISSSDPAYVIYTSGTTGQPKGVVVTHQNVVSLVKNSHFVQLDESDRLLSTGSPSFDAATFEYWGMLLNGGQLQLCSEASLLDPHLLKQAIQQGRCTKMWFTAGWFNELVNIDVSIFAGLQSVLVGGEKLSAYHVAKLRAAYHQLEIINGYGPTENTTFSLTYRIGKEVEDNIPIGIPLSNRRAYILDRSRQLCPVGVAGELCVGGAGVAAGYLNDSTLTASRFIDSPFESAERLYCTGDLARWLPDGNVEFLGRADDQVKIRGYRIELGEIESVLQQSAMVRQCVVVVKGETSDTRRLLAYIVVEEKYDKEALLHYLEAQLPYYMIPALLIELPELPLTNNGKVNRKALPEPDLAGLIDEGYIAPRNQTEEQVAAIWQDLLQLEKIGIHDKFFEIGGHSLLATRVVSAIRKQLSIEVGIKDLFEHPTIATLTSFIATKDHTVLLPKIVAAERPAKIPLSFPQERLWFIDKLQGSTHYHMPVALRFEGPLDEKILEDTFNEMINRHEVLRTVFIEEDGQAWQHILPKDQWTIAHKEISIDADKAILTDFIYTEVNKPFDLSKDHMLRACLIRLSENNHILVLVIHHIASDGWSEPIFVGELKAIYAAKKAKQAIDLPALPVQYADYAIWQRRYLDGEILDEKMKYWENKLSGINALNFPTDFVRPTRQSTKGDYLNFTLDPILSKQLDQLAKDEEVTIFMLLLTVFKILLYRYTGQKDICVGSPIANRTQSAIEPLIGFFVNTLALRSDLSDNPRFKTLLAQVKQTTLAAYEHQEVPFEKIVDRVESERDMSRSPLFQVLFAVQNNPEAPTVAVDELNFTTEASGFQTSKFDFTFNITQSAEHLHVGIEYCVDLFLPATIRRLMKHFELLLTAVVNTANQHIGALQFITDEERQQLLHEYNNTQVDYPREETIVHLFEKQLALTPERIALVYEEQTFTYQYLHEQANQLAHFLQQKGIGNGSLVALCINRSEEMIIAVLAILKAGGAYVPIDPAYPKERIDYIIKDTNSAFILSNTTCSKLFEWSAGAQLILIDKDKITIAQQAIHPPTTNWNAEHIACVIYTSGSTGRPKGVALTHRNINAFTHWGLREFAESEFEMIYMATSICFDLSIFEMFHTLSSGKKMRLLENGLSIGEWLPKDKGVLLNTVPSLMAGLLEEGVDMTNVKAINLAGEPFPPATRDQLDLERIEVRNLYGPTEDTTYSTGCRLVDRGRILIGRPIDNTQVYILDEYQNLLPPGVVGEVCISGDNLAKGYLNRPELTAEKFTTNPFSNDPSSKLYRSGDLARWLPPDGEKQTLAILDIIGRRDSQVKIRGYRVELGEIEQVLGKVDGVMSCAVLAKANGVGSKQLVAYVVMEQEIDKTALQTTLAAKLPAYMVPAIWLQLDQLPRTANGKINRLALPKPDASTLLSNEYVAPQTEQQQAMADIWQQILGVERVGITDNFFTVGGDSIILIRIISRMKKILGKEIKVAHFYETPTIIAIDKYFNEKASDDEEQQALTQKVLHHIETLKAEVMASLLDAADVEDVYPMSDIQKGMIFASILAPESGVYHDQFIFQLPMVDIPLFERCFQLMTEKHTILRSAFNLHDFSEEVQLVYRSVPVKMDVHDLTTATAAEQEDYIHLFLEQERKHPFDASSAPLWRAAIFRLDAKRMVYLLQFHHAILDGWSIASMNTELNDLYLKLQSEPTHRPTPLMADCRTAIIENLIEKENKAQLLFWQKELTDYKRIDIFSAEEKHDAYVKIYPPTYLNNLRVVAQKLGHSMNDLLFGVFLYALKLLTRENDLTVGLVSNVRPICEDGDKILGCFLNSLPIRFKIGTEALQSWTVYLKELSEHLKMLKYRDRITLYEIAQACKENTTNGNPFFDVLFNFTDFHVYDDLEVAGEIEVEQEEDGALQLVGFGDTNTLLDVSINLTGGKLTTAFATKKTLASGITMQQLGMYFEQILETVSQNADAPIDHSALFTPEVKKQLLHDFNKPTTTTLSDQNIIELFVKQAVQTPSATAAIFKEKTISYRQLDQQSNQIANYLLQHTTKENPLIAICIDRSIDMLVGILAILKAGAAYVPIDPDFPQERIDFLLSDTAAEWLLTNEKCAKKLSPKTKLKLIVLDEKQAAFTQQSTAPPTNTIRPEQLAYIIYTSGSTGQPKGVMITHRNLSIRLQSEVKLLRLHEKITSCLLTNYIFDVSLLELFLPLIKGGSILIPSSKDIYDPIALLQLMGEKKVNLIQGTPTYITSLMQALTPTQAKLLHFEQLCIGGESMSDSLVKMIHEKLPTVKINNHYGPTEITIDAIVLEEVTSFEKDIIGRPLPHTQAYIVDANNQLSPLGVIGELLIGGEGVAAGYLNRAELTKTTFINNPFETDENARLYRTGDLAYWLPDGNIVFAGRKDEQVKIRGYRIELGEIENVIMATGEVEHCVVLAKAASDGSKQLIAYIVAEGGMNKERLTEYLSEKLPAYMVPAVWIDLEQLPLTATGKVNKKALPDPELLQRAYIAPTTEVEQQLAKIWRDLLKTDRVGVNDNFFELGGHSLLAMRAAAAIRKDLDKEIEVRLFFSHPTIAELAQLLAQQKEGSSLPAIQPQEREGRIPLSFSQERLWFIDQLEGSVQYHMPTVLLLEGSLDKDAMEQAFQIIVNRHEVLRTQLKSEDGHAYQHVMPVDGWKMIFAKDAALQDEAQLKAYIASASQKPFDLASDYMLRVHLIQLAKEKHILLMVLHHIASDGWSGGILIDELLISYRANLDQQQALLPTLPIQYADYAIWQRKQLSATILEEQLKWWESQLQGVAPLNLPTDFPRPTVQSKRGAVYGFKIGKELTAALKALALSEGATLFMTLLSAFKVLLYRYSGQEDICVGTPISNRDQKELEPLIGFFINTLALRSEFSGDATFIDLLQQVRAQTLAAYAYQQVPFEQIVERVEPERDLSRSPLFQVMFILHNTPESGSTPDLGGLTISSGPYEHSSAQYDLSCSVSEGSEELAIGMEYCTDLFTAETIARMAQHFELLLSAIVENARTRIGQLRLLTAKEEHQLLNEYNNTQADYPKEKTVLHLIKEQVSAIPHQVALVFEKEEVTYQELDERSNQLGHYLRQKGVEQETLVALCIDRSVEMIVAMLAILKSGGAYVPIDPAYPQERIDYIIKDAKAEYIISNTACHHLFQSSEDVQLILMDEDGGEIAEQLTNPLTLNSQANQIAYVIYTSGSTGRPKGVAISHGNVNAFLHWCKAEFAASDFEIIYAVTSICFDLSIFEIFYTLSSGKKMRLLENGLHIGEYLEKDEAVLLNTVPSVMASLLEEEVNLGTVNVINLAGEPIPLATRDQLDLDRIEVRNLYGPSEDTTYSTIYRLQAQKRILIGRPIANTQVYILDDYQNLLPPGIIGELCISGDNVSKGYLNRPALTEEKFIKNPFSNDPSSRLYRTGDLARWLPPNEATQTAAQLDFIGRKDSQVKIRGYRIELGEIEQMISRIEGVNNCVVLARVDATGAQQLVAYLMMDGEMDKDYLRTVLNTKLPAYMVPALWLQLDSFPLTANGKVNKRALPMPDASTLLRNEYAAPQTEQQQLLVNNWQQVLKVERVGITDNFFELGGNSIKLVQLMARIRKSMAIDFELRQLFSQPTIIGFLNELENKEGQPSSLIYPLNTIAESQPTLFCLPPILGLPMIYQNFASLLESKVNVYGLQYQSLGANNTLPPATSIAEIAERMYEEILPFCQTNEQQRIHLMGFSFGTYIAFELAQRLEQHGITFQLILVDAPYLDRPIGEGAIAGLEISAEFEKAFEANYGPEFKARATELYLNNRELLKTHVVRGTVLSDTVVINGIHDDLEEGIVDMSTWQEVVKGNFVSHVVEGKHDELFVTQNEDLAQLILRIT